MLSKTRSYNKNKDMNPTATQRNMRKVQADKLNNHTENTVTSPSHLA